MSKTAKESFLPPLWILTLLGAALSLWLLSELKEILVLLVIGYCIAYIVHPALVWMEKRKVSRGVGLFVVFGLFAIFVSILAITAVPTIAKQYQVLSENLPSYVEQAREKIKPLIEKARSYYAAQNGPEEGAAPDDPMAFLSKIGGGTLKTVLSGVMTALLQGYSLTLFLANLVLLPFIVFYLAVDFEKIHSTLLAFFPKSQRRNVSQIVSEIDVYVSAFVRGQLIVCTLLFVLYAIGLGIIGIDLWFLMAVLAGFGNMIPYFGTLLGISLSSIMALVTFGDFSHVLQVWLVFGVVQFLEGFVITPKVVGGKVGFSPLMIILAIFAGGKLFGLLGVFLAIPGAAILRVLAKHMHSWILKTSAV